MDVLRTPWSKLLDVLWIMCFIKLFLLFFFFFVLHGKDGQYKSDSFSSVYMFACLPTF